MMAKGGSYFGLAVKRALSGKMTFERNDDWWDRTDSELESGEERLGSNNSMCKGPEMGMSLVYLRNRKQAGQEQHERNLEK